MRPRRSPSPNCLPKDYKGPISGYYERVNSFFEKKRQLHEESMRKEKSIPRINKRNDNSEEQYVPVEERLLQKGQEYKQNLNHMRHEMVQNEITEGP